MAKRFGKVRAEWVVFVDLVGHLLDRWVGPAPWEKRTTPRQMGMDR